MLNKILNSLMLRSLFVFLILIIIKFITLVNIESGSNKKVFLRLNNLINRKEYQELTHPHPQLIVMLQ